jgi:hypothetical protein
MTALTLSPPVRTRNFRRIFAIAAALLLAVPLVAMPFTGEVNWGPEDFLVAGVMFAGLGAGIDLTLRLPASLRVRLTLIAGAVAAFLFVWAELAVGLSD